MATDFPVIDPNVGLMGMTGLRTMSADVLAAMVKDKSYIVHNGDERLAVLISYERFLRMQEIIRRFRAPLEETK